MNGVQTGGGREGAPGPRPQPPELPEPETVETSPEETLPEELPKLLPLPGPLREEGGILWWSDVRCRAGSLELASGAVELLAEEHCRLWPAPGGAHAVAVSASRSDALEGRGLVLIEGRAGEARVLAHPPGFVASELAWAPDGLAFAACLGTREGVVLDVRPLEGAGSAGLAGAGLCFPAWVPERGLAAARIEPVSIELAGETVLPPAAAAELLPSVPEGARREVSALAGGAGGRLAAALVVVSDERLLPFSGALAVLSGNGSVEFSAALRQGVLPTALGLAPDGSALWYFDAGAGTAVVVAVPGGRRLPLFTARWVAWSPSGRYVAAATAEGIVVSTWPDLAEVAVVPVDANDVSWTRSP